MKNNLSNEDILSLVGEMYDDPGLFCRVILPQWFGLPMPWVHRGALSILLGKTDWLLRFGEEAWPQAKGQWDEKQLDKILRHFVWRADPDDPSCEPTPVFIPVRREDGSIERIDLHISDKVLIIMPRGLSKTTIVNAANLFDICYHDTKFLVYISEAATHADQQLDNIKREMEGNSMLLTLFGKKKPERSDSEHWNASQAETVDGIAISARGRGGQIRGMNYRGERPNKIVFDDVEDKESVQTIEQRNKVLDWMMGDVVPALPQIKGGGRIIGLGTIIHAEALLMTLTKDPEWLTIKFGAIDPDGEAIWDHYMSLDQIQRRKRSFMRTGQLHIFNMEYMSTIRSEDDGAKFKLEYFRYETLSHSDFPARALAMDPAISEKKKSDFCAFAVVGMTEKGRIHVLHADGKRGMTPRQMIDEYFRLKFLFDTNKNGIETVGFQKALVHLMREEMFRKGREFGPRAYFEIEEITHGHLNKLTRVEGVLSPRYAAGYITHQRHFPLLEEQLLDWPIGKKDIPDALAMAVMLLDPFAAWAGADEAGDDPLGKDQYPPLEEIFGDSYHYGAP